MKKVLILNYGLHISGVSRTLVNFANALVNNGYDVTVKIESNDFTLQSELDSRVHLSLFLQEPHFFGHRVKGFLRFYAIWLRILLSLPAKWQYHLTVREKYDIEIAYNRGAGAKIISGSTNKKARKLVWVHNDYVRVDNALAGFRNLKDAQKGYAAFDKIICVSRQAEKAFSERFGPGFPLTTCFNVIDVERIVKRSSQIDLPKDTFSLTAVGRLCEAKNYSLLLDAIRILKDRGKNPLCYIVGGGSLEAELHAQKKTWKLDNVVFTGALENPYPYIATADLYVSSSVYEGLSTTTIEALILGKPCVVTDCTGMRDILGENAEYGLIVPVNDAVALADAIEKMMDDNELRASYERKAKERAAYFDPQNMFATIEKNFG